MLPTIAGMTGTSTARPPAGNPAGQRASAPIRILIADDQIAGALRAGAKGYLLKGVPRAEIFNAIRVVHAGGSLLQPIVTSKLMHSLEHDGQSLTPPVEPLTERETQVLRLPGQGITNKEIAATLYISERTVKFHVSAILGKLGAGIRSEAVAAAAQRGLVKVS